ncbi:hypothetical protein [Actinosynnema pretiosum]|uniref:Uncharacterized protein n=2 Tax=Actinosynnema TaxID=40566 RepID=A0A290ZD92_9PSEU|nr:hypothetical protein [Actinosynnema pretiosum]ATE56954.1 hypothetical protein CNX65_29735 [Actinosynnema pretiosum]
MLPTTLVLFGLSWWLGLHLLARDPRAPLLRRSAAGLLAHAVALAVQPAPALLLALPAVAWTGALACGLGPRWDRVWAWTAPPLLAAAWFFPPIVLPPLVFALVLHVRGGPPRPLLAVATTTFGLGTALLVGDLLPEPVLLLAIGVDLLLLGVLVVAADAFDGGEAFRAGLLRSLLVSTATAALFAAQVALLAPSRPLLFGVIATAIAVQALAGPLAALADRVALPGAAAQRAELRAAAESLSKRAPLPVAELPAADLAKLTRRALSHYGDLGRLVASPLTALPVVDARLAARGAPDQPLERAAELKALLREGIRRLKPADGEFGTSDEWRHYNALHFYYVVGLRPHSARTKRENLDPVARQALAWFATQVPERTLHNWQTAGAKLIAADLAALSAQVTRS